ncbi:DUF3043 domain-containing protein [Nocardioides sp. BP30]|uniref:DUF3043 domain-containing protein n=1 Tax=Nocardioides sp. BP30 TaxID=3036374 RepID=UPI002468773B|nr:DUF3043 domain-containing protein [Nocardioides sp. BP30]WGL53769.1 DUF3043 domain-containing protein [Nocardioides sp. BP30]
MFRRKSEAAEPAVIDTTKSGGKGRPTPTRKEAEAAAKARARAPHDRRAAAAAQRAARTEGTAKMRAALRTGDERYLPMRDKGPVRRFVRDYLDTKVTFAEFALPIVFVCLVPAFFLPTNVVQIFNDIMLVLIVVIALNMLVLRVGLGRQLARRFPGVPTRGLTWYMCSRAMQLRWIRSPKPQRRVGEQLPDTYR